MTGTAHRPLSRAQEDRNPPVQAWLLPLTSPPSALLTRLSAREIERADEFRNPADRDRFVVARLALRALLGQCTDTAPHRVVIIHGAHGAPIVSGTNWTCSVSHAGQWILIGLCHDCPIGVDIEPLREIGDAALMARSFFHPEECALVNLSDSEHRSLAFLRVWVRKEAVLKAAGLGLKAPLNDWRVVQDAAWVSHTRASGLLDSPSGPWWVSGIDVGSSCVAAVATGTNFGEIQVRRTSLLDLV